MIKIFRAIISELWYVPASFFFFWETKSIQAKLWSSHWYRFIKTSLLLHVHKLTSGSAFRSSLPVQLRRRSSVSARRSDALTRATAFPRRSATGRNRSLASRNQTTKTAVRSRTSTKPEKRSKKKKNGTRWPSCRPSCSTSSSRGNSGTPGSRWTSWAACSFPVSSSSLRCGIGPFCSTSPSSTTTGMTQNTSPPGSTESLCQTTPACLSCSFIYINYVTLIFVRVYVWHLHILLQFDHQCGAQFKCLKAVANRYLNKVYLQWLYLIAPRGTDMYYYVPWLVEMFKISFRCRRQSSCGFSCDIKTVVYFCIFASGL